MLKLVLEALNLTILILVPLMLIFDVIVSDYCVKISGNKFSSYPTNDSTCGCATGVSKLTIKHKTDKVW